MASELSHIDLSFEGQPVRIVMRDGHPWYVLADVCQILELQRKPAAVAERLDKDEVRTAYLTDSSGRRQEMLIVSLPAYFRVTRESRKPAAERFRRWNDHEVLPSIYKTGSYSLPNSTSIPAILDELFSKQTQTIAEAIKGTVVPLFKEISSGISAIANKGRRDCRAEDERIHLKGVLYYYHGKCLTGCNTTIANDSGFLPNCSFHHAFNRNDNKLESSCFICNECHDKVERDPEFRTRFNAFEFPTYQRMIAQLVPRQIGMESLW